jgi:hypothetical protein
VKKISLTNEQLDEIIDLLQNRCISSDIDGGMTCSCCGAKATVEKSGVSLDSCDPEKCKREHSLLFLLMEFR